MEKNHLSLETLAKWLAGRLDHDAVLQQIVPHLVATCPVCRERYEQIEEWLDKVRGTDTYRDISKRIEQLYEEGRLNGDAVLDLRPADLDEPTA